MQKEVVWTLDVDELSNTRTGYDMILGRDFLYALGFVLDFEKRKVKWNGISVPMSSNIKPRTFARKKVSEIRPRTFVRKKGTARSNNNNYIQKSEPTGQPAKFSKIRIPANIRKDILSWYHAILYQPGQHIMIDTMSQHMFWKGMNKDIIKFVQTCPACQKRKSHRRTFAKLPLNLQSPKPCQVLSVDLVGPYEITDADKKKYELTALTMADPATGWFEIIELPHGHTGEQVALALDRTWFSRYPRPQPCRFDNGREFISAEFKELLESYGIKPSPTTIKNPKANFVERVHQTLGNMLRTAELDEHTLDPYDPFTGILANCA